MSCCRTFFARTVELIVLSSEREDCASTSGVASALCNSGTGVCPQGEIFSATIFAEQPHKSKIRKRAGAPRSLNQNVIREPKTPPGLRLCRACGSRPGCKLQGFLCEPDRL